MSLFISFTLFIVFIAASMPPSAVVIFSGYSGQLIQVSGIPFLIASR